MEKAFTILGIKAWHGQFRPCYPWNVQWSPLSLFCGSHNCLSHPYFCWFMARIIILHVSENCFTISEKSGIFILFRCMTTLIWQSASCLNGYWRILEEMNFFYNKNPDRRCDHLGCNKHIFPSPLAPCYVILWLFQKIPVPNTMKTIFLVHSLLRFENFAFWDPPSHWIFQSLPHTHCGSLYQSK